MTYRNLDYNCMHCGNYMFTLPVNVSTEELESVNKTIRLCSDKCRKNYKPQKHKKVVEKPTSDFVNQWVEYAKKNGVLK